MSGHTRRSSLYFLEFVDLSKKEFASIREQIVGREDVSLSGTSVYPKLRFTFRATSDESATEAAKALSAGRVSALYTGLGIHRRLVSMP